VGHGGASGYLALMALFSISPEVMKPTALLLNLFVSFTSFIQYYRGGHFNWKIFLSFAITSVPLAYLGGKMNLADDVYKKILGVLLMIPIIRFLFFTNSKVEELKRSNFYVSFLIGAAIGYLSGLIGIGGGIILSPVLLLLKWADMKQTAAISALFIFVNSLSGFIAQLQKGLVLTMGMYAYVAVAFAGGLCGAYFGSLKFKQNILQYLLALVLIIASYKLLFTSA
jgi:uncharacterized membrane protein YfcA